MKKIKKENNKEFSYLFGPVPSRRLGISLGVDIVPAKTCSMDCIYCESGRTTDLTAKRLEYFPTSEIIAELDSFLSGSPEIDFVTFSGAGEPTLHSGIGKIINFLKTHYPEYKVALLTNAMMLMEKEVFLDVLPVDLIVPSLDAVEAKVFSTINRPVFTVDCVELVNTLAEFKQESKALFYLEIFIVPGINDTPLSIDLLTAAVARIKPDKVQLNSLDRPGTEPWVRAASREELEFVAEKISKAAKVEIVGKFNRTKQMSGNIEIKDDELVDRIVRLISRRPCTRTDIAEALNCQVDSLETVLNRMVNEGKITVDIQARGQFYKIN